MSAKTSLHKAKSQISSWIWRERLDQMDKIKAFFICPVRIVINSVKGTIEDGCFTKASSLTLFSIFSVIPVFALAFAISKGFGIEKLLEMYLFERFPGQEVLLGDIHDGSGKTI